MKKLGLAFAVSTVVLLVGSCAPRVWRMEDWYFAPKIAALPQLEAVAVYLFIDGRVGEDDPRAIGTSAWHGETGRYFRKQRYASEPVAIVVTRAFADGLRALGFPVVDMTTTPFARESVKANARVAVSGEVERLSANHDEDAGLIVAGCSVIVRAYEMKTGQELWERAYVSEHFQRGVSFTGWFIDPLIDVHRSLVRVLTETVEKAVNDPELVKQLSRH